MAGAILQGEMRMGIEKIDYAAIVADLEAKRAALDNAISSLKTVLISGALGPSEGTSYVNLAATIVSGAAPSGEIPDGAFHGKSIPEGIRLYLELMRKKQTAREIADGLKKGGMETKSKWFEKIVYATLDRLKKTREVVKIRSEWGLPQWYPALMRAGISNSENGSSASRPRERRKSSVRKPPSRQKVSKSEVRPSESIKLFLRVNPGLHDVGEIKSATHIENPKVATMLLGQLVKKGEVEKTADGRYRKT
jgi:hypothetical protein